MGPLGQLQNLAYNLWSPAVEMIVYASRGVYGDSTAKTDETSRLSKQNAAWRMINIIMTDVRNAWFRFPIKCRKYLTTFLFFTLELFDFMKYKISESCSAM